MKRGRQSGAALSIIPLVRDHRPEPPQELNEDQRAEWQAIVGRLPADWFPRELHGILAAFCRHVTAHRLISAEVDLYHRDWLKDDEGLKRLDKLTSMRERESRAMVAVARSLRITKASQVRPETAGRAVRGTSLSTRKPWDDPIS